MPRAMHKNTSRSHATAKLDEDVKTSAGTMGETHFASRTRSHRRNRSFSAVFSNSVRIFRCRVRGNLTTRPFAHDQQRIEFFDKDERPLFCWTLVAKRHHLADVIELLPKLRIHATPH